MQIISTRTFRIITALYILLLYLVAFWPFDFLPVCPSHRIRWINPGDGVRITPCSVLSTPEPPEELREAFLKAEGFTIEILLMTSEEDQRGPARIVSFSRDTSHRNFTLGQEKDALVLRLRTTETGPNGSDPALSVDQLLIPGVRQHITVTYDGSRHQVYLEGRAHRNFDILGGDFSTWAPGQYLMIGNEYTGKRPWYGEVFLVALYNRALPAAEVAANFEAAFTPPGDAREARRVKPGLVALYEFQKGKGSVVPDRSPAGAGGELKPARFRSFFRNMADNATYRFGSRDMILNILAFIPLGILVWFSLPRDRRVHLLFGILTPVAAGFLVSLSIEFVQQYSFTRNPNLLDVIYNTAGSMAGVVLVFLTRFSRTR